MSLVACPECSRHIRNTEAACPFCSADVGARLAAMAPRAMPTARLGRAALFAFAAASASAVACASESDDGQKGTELRDGGEGEDDAANAALYGAPAPTGGASNAGGSANAGGDDGAGGAIAALYGAVPAPGAGGDFAAPAYGAPFPTTDAAPPAEEDGGFAALYGAAPEYGAPPPPDR